MRARQPKGVLKMYITRSPCRIPLGGGGTDLPSYYEKYEGFLISGAINKYCIVAANKLFTGQIKLSYAERETVNTVDDIKHNLFREALKQMNILSGIEIHSIADVPSGTGLGSSGAFLVALLNTLYLYKYGKPASKRQLAEMACHIEIEVLKEHEGKQDKYATAFGAINAYTFRKGGFVDVRPLTNEDLLYRELEQKLFLFFTGQMRQGTASSALKDLDENLKKDNMDKTQSLHKIKEIGLKTKDAFEHLELDKFGYLLDEHWKIKKHYSPHSTSPQIDDWYDLAIDNGALGGKIMGSGGGGGFFMFYHPCETPTEQWHFVDAMTKKGLINIPFAFDQEGVSTLVAEKIDND
jgi:D-glycero-alpha-D-manno-heptose-7-phosphate kinase